MNQFAMRQRLAVPMANRQDAQPSKASAAMRGSTFMPAPSRNFDRDLSALAVLKGATMPPTDPPPAQAGAEGREGRHARQRAEDCGVTQRKRPSITKM
ncbi:hypothetical protein [Mesorhizobium sp. M1E.F.Ca.ET.045.02.1.1]|uniref:hypothetical protein n=1 Tax=Mesorhizobium sp. M1E.F.Ca.ET.045.02.1.1 TaxID=2493672 RepID=UPI001674B2C3|nr:hypothetical protein [Mesorhizobium sp. M1E.F.Ca.ET.045.02.1.1]